MTRTDGSQSVAADHLNHAMLDASMTLAEKANRLLDFLLIERKIKHLVFDWDLTILCTHSGGFVEPQHFSTIVDSITEDWIVFITEAKRRGIPFYIATFSDAASVELSRQKTLAAPSFQMSKLNRRELDSYFNSLIAGESLVYNALRVLSESRFGDSGYLTPQAVVAKYPENYQLPERYVSIGLKKPMKRSKSYHLEMLCRRIGHAKPLEFILFDDDPQNIHDAGMEGYNTAFVSNDPKLTKAHHGFRLHLFNMTVSHPAR